jgi:gluconate kinase
MVIVLMGPAESGTAAVARLLADRLRWPLIDEPPSDAHRVVRVGDLRGAVARALERREPLVLACPVLSAAQRVQLAGDMRQVRFVVLHVPAAAQQAHGDAGPERIAGSALLNCLVDRDDPGDRSIALDGSADPDAIVGHIRLQLGV